MSGCPEVRVKTKQYELSLSFLHPNQEWLITQEFFFSNVTTDANILLWCNANDPSVHVKIRYRCPESRLSPVKHTNASGHSKG